MRFKALACDYDGTLASEDRMGAEVVVALEDARKAGLRLILVTGRTFFGLTRVCERLDLFDVVVAENGGVLYFPAEGIIRDQAPRPSLRLLSELDRRGIAFEVGRIIIGTARRDENAVREALASTGVHLQLVYNRDALMLLPDGVSKGAGVRQAIRAFGLSFHDVLAVGDAENDLDLFEACGWTACPANAVPALKERADWSFPGEDGEAIAQAIVGPIVNGFLPMARSPRHRIALGWARETSEPVAIPARGVNLLIQGDSLSGKSWLVGLFVERLLNQRYAVCVIDPEGDFHVLRRLRGVAWVQIREPGSWEGALGHFDRDPSACVVADLSALPHPPKLKGIEAGLVLIRELRSRLRLPHWVFLDEAHYSLHRDGIPDGVLGVEDKGFCVATYRASWLRESVRGAMDFLVLARTTIPEELAFLRSLVGGSSGGTFGAVSVLPELAQGEFLLIRHDETGNRIPLAFVAAPRQTPHIRHLKKYVEIPLPTEKYFVFRRPDGRLIVAVGSLSAFRRAVGWVEEGVLVHHAGRGDFSRWILDVFVDRGLGEQLREIEGRWSRGEVSDLRQVMNRLFAARYGVE